MKCPECGKDMEKGSVQVHNVGSLIDLSTMVSWCPENQKGKILKKGTVNLGLKAVGYYCDECMKVFAAFEEK